MPLFLYSGITLFQLSLLVIFTIRSGRASRTRRRLQLALLTATMAILSFLLIDLEMVYGIDLLEDEVYVASGRLFYVITYFLLYLFWEGGLNDRPRPKRLALMSFLGGASASLNLLVGISPSEYVGMVQFLGDTVRSTFGIAIFTFGAMYQYKVQAITKELTARVQYSGSLIIVLAFVVQLFATPMISGANVGTLQTVSDALILLGVFSFFIFYSINPKLVERIPVQTFEILVYAKSGINFHSVQVSTKGIDPDMDRDQRVMLMSGLSSALTEFLKAATGTEQELETIEASDRVIIFSLGSIQISMVAEAMTEVLIDSLHNLRLDYEEHSEASNKQLDEIEPLPSELFEQLINYNFPYLDVIDIVTQGP